jgi:uncharacterized SAM-dependent methyltransferase
VTSLRAARRTLADDVPARRHGAGTLERYVPFDVDGGMVRDTAAALAEEYPGLEVEGITGDFENDLDQIPPPQPGAPRILHVLNRELDADFDAGNFEHVLRRGARVDRDAAARPPRPLVRELVERMTDPEGLFALSLSRTAPGAAPPA